MACSEEELHYNDIGTVMMITMTDCVSGTPTVLDISGASSLEVILNSPSGISSTKTAVLDDDGTDGKMKYTTQAGDLNEVGTWRIQAKVSFGSSTFRSNIKTFRVYENL